MKKIYFLFIICFSVLSFISCDKDDDGEENPELNKLNYNNELYNLESFKVQALTGNYFVYNSYCTTKESEYGYNLFFYDTKSIKPDAKPLLTIYIGPDTNFNRAFPLELNSCQSSCRCLFVDFMEETSTNSLVRHTSVEVNALIISLKPIEIIFEGFFDDDKKFSLHFKGKSVPEFPKEI